MAYSNQTTHYGLPLPTSGDKSTFLDTNESFGRIDGAIYGAATDASAAKQQSDGLALEVNDLKVSVLGLKASVLDAQTDINLLMANVTQAMSDIDQLEVDTNKLKLDVTDLMVSQLPKKIDTFSGQVQDEQSQTYTAVTADGIAYDETNNQLLLKVDGADTVIPFSRGGVTTGLKFALITEYQSTDVNMISDGVGYTVSGANVSVSNKMTSLFANTTHFTCTTGSNSITLTNVDLPGYFAIAQRQATIPDSIFHMNTGETLTITNLESGNLYQVDCIVFIYLGENNPFA